MIESNEFKNWLKENSKYSDGVIGDTVSRMKRADHILEWEDDELYQYHLEHLEEYSELSVSVRSQINRAVSGIIHLCNRKEKNRIILKERALTVKR